MRRWVWYTHTYLNKWERDSFTGAADTRLFYTLPNDSCQKRKKMGKMGLTDKCDIFNMPMGLIQAGSIAKSIPTLFLTIPKYWEKTSGNGWEVTKRKI